ncbi:MAG: aminopeptidase [Ignavibacteria bacterium]|nr:aminopeptidase [Ignavibacteria bacterium]MBI3766200.1 aminopeptidase [Ignavibacteriales bacterium]
MVSDLHSAALIAVRDCMGVKPGEKVLVVTDEPLRKIGYALWRAAKDLGNEVLFVEIFPRKTNGEEPPLEVAELMKMADVVLAPTSKSLTHTDSRRAASARGARVATLPGVTEEIMIRCMNADYHRIAERTFRLCEMLEKTKTVRVTAPRGTDVTLPIEGRRAYASSGLFHQKGESGNLPTGEAYLAPLEGTSNGVVAVDGSMAMIGMVKQPIKIVVRNGYAEEITGGGEAYRLTKLLEPHGREGRTVAEFGIGTNDKAILSGLILEDEKVMGTIHIAFGDNKSMGGTVRVASHLDGLIREPTVWFDDRIIMKDGAFTVSV